MTIRFERREARQGAIYVEAYPDNEFEDMAMRYYDDLGGVLAVLPEMMYTHGITLTIKHNNYGNDFQALVFDPRVRYEERIVLTVSSGTSPSCIYACIFVIDRMCKFNFDTLIEIVEGPPKPTQLELEPF